LADRLAALEKTPIPRPLDQRDIDGALARYKGEIEAEVGEMVRNLKLDGLVDPTQLAELAIRGMIGNAYRFMSSTGVVVAGYGDHDYFPRYNEYECYGLLLGKFLFKEKDSEGVSLDRPAYISAFATTAMIDTFQPTFSI